MREVCRRDKLNWSVVRTLKEEHIFFLNYIEVSVVLREATGRTLRGVRSLLGRCAPA
jgi:hypothetical protein